MSRDVVDDANRTAQQLRAAAAQDRAANESREVQEQRTAGLNDAHTSANEALSFRAAIHAAGGTTR